MRPSDLRSYLQQRGQVSLIDLSARFDASPELVQEVMTYWQRKGKVIARQGSCGSSCKGCAAGQVTFYDWQE